MHIPIPNTTRARKVPEIQINTHEQGLDDVQVTFPASFHQWRIAQLVIAALHVDEGRIMIVENPDNIEEASICRVMQRCKAPTVHPIRITSLQKRKRFEASP
jgi:hypothetical protein